jgi:hypothetical protein
VSSHDTLAGIWQYLLAGASSAGVLVGSHLRTRDRVKELEVKQEILADRTEILTETHDTVIRMEIRMSSFENDLRDSTEAFTAAMTANSESQMEINSTLDKIKSAFQID